MNFRASDSGLWEFFGSAGVGETGSHVIEIMVVDTSGLESFVKATINIKPNLGGSSSSNDALPTGWDEQWIGTYAISNNGWCYHTVWDWVWLQPSNNMNDLWFLLKRGIGIGQTQITGTLKFKLDIYIQQRKNRGFIAGKCC